MIFFTFNCVSASSTGLKLKIILLNSSSPSFTNFPIALNSSLNFSMPVSMFKNNEQRISIDLIFCSSVAFFSYPNTLISKTLGLISTGAYTNKSLGKIFNYLQSLFIVSS